MFAVVLLGAVFAIYVGVAGAAPLGQITEFAAPGTNPAQVVAGPDGNFWFSDRNGSVGGSTTGGTVTRFTTGLNPGSAVRSIAMGADGNMWFSDPGTTKAVGMINPITQAISEFKACPRAACRSGSRQARTGTSGSPTAAPRRRSG